MDLKTLTTFISVAELSSFTKTARTLGYSQSTISFQIHQLEEELNAQLFERINHTVVLTERGKEVLRYAYQVQQLTAELTETMESRSSPHGHIRLAMADSLCNSLLERQFLTFRERHPNITLKIIAAGTEEMFRLINHNEVDAILTLDNHVYNTEYVIAREKKVAMHFVASPASPLCQAGPLSVEELARQPFLLTERNMSYRRLLDEKLAALSLEIHPLLEVGSTALICSLVEQNAGISFLPDYVTAEKAAAGSLVYLPAGDFSVEVWKQLLYHRDKWISPQLAAVLDYCIEREF